MQYTQFDLDVIKSFKVRFKSASTQQAYKDISGDIEFQFPPVITGDSKRGNWQDALQIYDEPTSIYQSVGPREITMNLKYIVSDASEQSDTVYRQLHTNPDFRSQSQIWTAERIHLQLRKLRGYFNVSRNGNSALNQNTGDALVLEIKLAGMGGVETMTARMTSVDVKHSETLVSYYSDKAYRPSVVDLNTFPLRTDVSVGLRLWHKNADGDTEFSSGGQKVIQNVPGLKTSLTVDWY